MNMITVPKGGRIHIVSVLVNESRPWKDAASAAGPNTGRDRDIWKVGDQYSPVVGATQGLQQVILVNFGKHMRSEDVLDWGKEQHLRPASPRSVLAISEHYPNLNRDLTVDNMTVISLVTCSFGGERRVPYVWWDESLRKSNLSWFDYEWREDYWFAFVRE